MPLTPEEEKIFQYLRRKKDREYAKMLRDRTRKKKYGARTTRKDTNSIDVFTFDKNKNLHVKHVKAIIDLPVKKTSDKKPKTS